MLNKDAYENAKESMGGPLSLPCGAYVCKIHDATDFPEKQYIVIEYDIADGEYKGYAADTAERAGFWPLKAWLSYKDRAIGMFKGRIKAVESANPNWTFDFTDRGMIGKLFYATVVEEEYTKSDGSIGTRNNLDKMIKYDDYKAGRFKVPGKILVTQAAEVAQASSASNDFLSQTDDNDLPF